MTANDEKQWWDSNLSEVYSFCDKYEIILPNMDDMFVDRKRAQCKAEVTDLHYFRVEILSNTILTCNFNSSTTASTR